LSSSFSSDRPGAVGVKRTIPVWVLVTIAVLSLEICSASAQTFPGKVKATLLDITDDSKAEISVLVSDATFAFGVSTLDTWLTPHLAF
jgi:hypothetical protein